MSFEESGHEPVMMDGFYRSRTGLNYTYLFYYEKKFFNDEYVNSKQTWMSNNWHLSLYYALAYVIAIFAGQAYMRTKDKYDLRRPLIAWNLVLAAFSLLGTVRVWPEFVHTIATKGVEHSICDKDYTHGVTGCWAWLFVLSKVPELVDTLFIVLRKQELIFLHWYHHATVLVYCWFSTKDFSASGRWFVLMNYTVHAAMYAYYGCRAMRFRIPKWVNIVITSGQISQMIIGIYVNSIAYSKKKRGEYCGVSDENITWSFIMYFSYFLLFFHFFYNAYIAPSPKKQRQTPTNTDSGTPLLVESEAAKKALHANGSASSNGHPKQSESKSNGMDSNNNLNKKQN
jgi:elongation of very long chain fatty acids protein 6